MFKLFNVIEKIDSEYNGTIQVIRDFSGTRILAGGVSQSGWLVKSVWNSALKKVKQYYPKVDNVLILGLGGGSVAGLAQNYWNEAVITGVDIDPIMVDLGKKYLGLDKVKKLKVEIDDATNWVTKTTKGKDRFDLILVDLYKGANIPKQFKEKEFIKNLIKICKSNGAIAFNHLYSKVEKEKAHGFERVLKELFPTVVRVYPEANVIYICVV